jgi:hypothetical protein
MIGARPNNAEFHELFDGPELLAHLPYDSSDIDILIKELDGDPERQDRMRRSSLMQALMRHDWVYRWETVLKTVGLEPM